MEGKGNAEEEGIHLISNPGHRLHFSIGGHSEHLASPLFSVHHQRLGHTKEQHFTTNRVSGVVVTTK